MIVAAIVLLLFVGLLGALDIALFHKRAHDLHHQPSARVELLPHFLRGPTYAVLFAVVPSFELAGGWFWAMVALLTFDVAISIWDFAVEKTSRAPMGGLPTGEYVLHSIIAMAFGGFAALWMAHGWPDAFAPAAITYAPHVPWMLQVVFVGMALGVFASGVADAVAWWRLGRAAP